MGVDVLFVVASHPVSVVSIGDEHIRARHIFLNGRNSVGVAHAFKCVDNTINLDSAELFSRLGQQVTEASCS